ncbi:hypothetical protein GPLA_0125 [Paraglaciecola polaris LMG 21857]|uniref:Uncharacterized protein n=1 Tax=Paraglaciecola polaris LMG 21857 TaxID=1129793 RepID=K6Z488_9ALTE|nr:hypothetical protein GPLA_0125 [Paraglaciecola polaris LMG 21857]
MFGPGVMDDTKAKSINALNISKVISIVSLSGNVCNYKEQNTKLLRY